MMPDCALGPNDGANIAYTYSVMDARDLSEIVTGPGDYVLRNGERATVYGITEKHPDPTVTQFRVKGSIWQEFRGKMQPRGYANWHVSGRFYGGHKECERDIVGPWVE